jgi:hypothetical protein
MSDPHDFRVGDLVHIAKDLGPMMRHFTADCDAIILELGRERSHNVDGSESDPLDRLCVLYIKGHGQTAWYHLRQLTLLEHNRCDLLKVWKDEQEAEDKMHGDLDWIFANGLAVTQGADGATIGALATCLGVTNLWGSRGEGMTYYLNAIQILHLAAPYLKTNDKAGWLAFCKITKETA